MESTGLFYIPNYGAQQQNTMAVCFCMATYICVGEHVLSFWVFWRIWNSEVGT